MKAQVVVLVLCLAFTTTSNANVDSLFETLRPRESEFDHRVVKARHEATLLLQEYLDTEPTADKAVLSAMVRGLKGAVITKRTRVRAGADQGNMCDNDPRSTAYVPTHPHFRQVIRLCRGSLAFTENQLIQLLLHEAFHLAEGLNGTYTNRIDAEVGATTYELAIIGKFHACSFVPQDYFDDPIYLAALTKRGVRKLRRCS